MKKFAKMSLVAAVALAGLTNVQAGSLEEAIKGVDISGQVRYRIQEKTDFSEEQDVNIDIKTVVPVNDNVSFVSNINIDNDNDEQPGSSNLGFNTSGFNMDQYYFQYTNGAVTALLGTQEIPGRLTDGLTASGIVGLYNAGAFTVGAASFYNSEVSDAMINSVIAMGSVGPVSLLGQYVDADDVLDSYNLKADATVGPVMLGVEYAETDEDANNDDYSTLKVYASAKLAALSAKLTYIKTADDGSGSIDGHNSTDGIETASEYLLWQLGSADRADMDVFAIDASYAVTDKVSLRAAYADGDYDNSGVKTDVSEALAQIGYKWSANLNTYIRYSQLDDEATVDKVDRGRVEVKYTF